MYIQIQKNLKLSESVNDTVFRKWWNIFWIAGPIELFAFQIIFNYAKF